MTGVGGGAAPYDVLGIGFGPANLALAVALEEDLPGVRARFVEAQAVPVWQGGMLLDGSNIQNHPSRDLVTLRNPRSRYSFLNYLFEQDRLVQHLNLAVEFPLRKEYAAYIRWVTEQFAHLVDTGRRVTGVRVVEGGGAPAYRVDTDGGRSYLARSLVVGTGRTPYVPAPFDGLSSPRVVHLTSYLPRLAALTGPPAHVVVVGGSQSAVEITLDLARRFPQARVTNYVRAFGLRLKDTSPFSEEGFFPGFVDYYHRATRPRKRALDRYLRATNYSAVDEDVLKELYLLLYEQQLDGSQRVAVRTNRQVERAVDTGAAVALDVRELNTGELERDDADLVILATGFRDLGPGPDQEPCPALLRDVVDRFDVDESGYLVVEQDYGLRPRAAATGTPPLFLNGLCESTHGIGDAGSFSLLSLRAAVIRDAVRRRLDTRAPALVAATGAPPSAAGGEAS